MKHLASLLFMATVALAPGSSASPLPVSNAASQDSGNDYEAGDYGTAGADDGPGSGLTPAGYAGPPAPAPAPAPAPTPVPPLDTEASTHHIGPAGKSEGLIKRNPRSCSCSDHVSTNREHGTHGNNGRGACVCPPKVKRGELYRRQEYSAPGSNAPAEDDSANGGADAGGNPVPVNNNPSQLPGQPAYGAAGPLTDNQASPSVEGPQYQRRDETSGSGDGGAPPANGDGSEQSGGNSPAPSGSDGSGQSGGPPPNADDSEQSGSPPPASEGSKTSSANAAPTAPDPQVAANGQYTVNPRIGYLLKCTGTEGSSSPDCDLVDRSLLWDSSNSKKTTDTTTFLICPPKASVQVPVGCSVVYSPSDGGVLGQEVAAQKFGNTSASKASGSPTATVSSAAPSPTATASE